MENFYLVENIDEPQTAAFYAQSTQSAQNSAQNSGGFSQNSQENGEYKEGEQPAFPDPAKYSDSAALETIKNNQNLAQNFSATFEQEYFKPTNIAYLDNKLKNGEGITGWEAYAANKYFGINLQDYGRQKVDLNAKVKGLGLTNLNQVMQMYQNNDEIFDRVVIGSEDNLGFLSGVERTAHKLTGGWKDLDDGEAEFLTSHKEAANALARAWMGGNKTTDQVRKQAAEALGLGLKSEKTFLEQLLSAKKTNLVAWQTAIQNAQTHGLPVNDAAILAFNKARQSVKDLDDALNNRKKWTSEDYRNYFKKYNSYANTAAGQNSQNSQNGEQKQAFRRVLRTQEY